LIGINAWTQFGKNAYVKELNQDTET